jgi:hypothetical protein
MQKNLGITYRVLNPLADPVDVAKSDIERLGKGEPDPQACAACEEKWMARLGLSADDELGIEEATLEYGGPQFNPVCPSCQADFEQLMAHLREYEARVRQILIVRQEANRTGLSWCGVGGAC